MPRARGISSTQKLDAYLSSIGAPSTSTNVSRSPKKTVPKTLIPPTKQQASAALGRTTIFNQSEVRVNNSQDDTLWNGAEEKRPHQQKKNFYLFPPALQRSKLLRRVPTPTSPSATSSTSATSALPTRDAALAHLKQRSASGSSTQTTIDPYVSPNPPPPNPTSVVALSRVLHPHAPRGQPGRLLTAPAVRGGPDAPWSAAQGQDLTELHARARVHRAETESSAGWAGVIGGRPLASRREGDAPAIARVEKATMSRMKERGLRQSLRSIHETVATLRADRGDHIQDVQEAPTTSGRPSGAPPVALRWAPRLAVSWDPRPDPHGRDGDRHPQVHSGDASRAVFQASAGASTRDLYKGARPSHAVPSHRQPPPADTAPLPCPPPTTSIVVAPANAKTDAARTHISKRMLELDRRLIQLPHDDSLSDIEEDGRSGPWPTVLGGDGQNITYSHDHHHDDDDDMLVPIPRGALLGDRGIPDLAGTTTTSTLARVAPAQVPAPPSSFHPGSYPPGSPAAVHTRYIRYLQAARDQLGVGDELDEDDLEPGVRPGVGPRLLSPPAHMDLPLRDALTSARLTRGSPGGGTASMSRVPLTSVSRQLVRRRLGLPDDSEDEEGGRSWRRTQVKTEAESNREVQMTLGTETTTAAARPTLAATSTTSPTTVYQNTAAKLRAEKEEILRRLRSSSPPPSPKAPETPIRPVPASPAPTPPSPLAQLAERLALDTNTINATDIAPAAITPPTPTPAAIAPPTPTPAAIAPPATDPAHTSTEPANSPLRHPGSPIPQPASPAPPDPSGSHQDQDPNITTEIPTSPLAKIANLLGLSRDAIRVTISINPNDEKAETTPDVTVTARPLADQYASPAIPRGGVRTKIGNHRDYAQASPPSEWDSTPSSMRALDARWEREALSPMTRFMMPGVDGGVSSPALSQASHSTSVRELLRDTATLMAESEGLLLRSRAATKPSEN